MKRGQVWHLIFCKVSSTVGRSVEKNFYSSQEPPALSRGQTRTGPGGGWLPVFSRAPSLIEEGARRTRRGPGGGGPPPSVSLRTPNLIHKEEDEKGALSLMEEDRTRRGPGGRGGYDPPAPRMMRGPGGRGPPLSSRGQDKEVEEGARRRRAPSLIEEGARSGASDSSRARSLTEE